MPKGRLSEKRLLSPLSKQRKYRLLAIAALAEAVRGLAWPIRKILSSRQISKKRPSRADEAQLADAAGLKLSTVGGAVPPASTSVHRQGTSAWICTKVGI